MSRHHPLHTALLIALLAAAPARAESFTLHLGGMCSTDYLGGKKGRAGLFDGWPGVRAINLRIDQRRDHTAAVEALVVELDRYCRGDNDCYMIVYSNGGAVTAQALSVYGGTPEHAWNINWVIHQGSNTGGSRLSEIAGSWYAGWLADIFTCDLADQITPDIHRSSFNHHDTDGVTFYMMSGTKSFWYSDAFLPDADDGAVGVDSSGGFVREGEFRNACTDPRWTNHVPGYACSFDKNHNEINGMAQACLAEATPTTALGALACTR